MTVHGGLIDKNDRKHLEEVRDYIQLHYSGETDIATLSRVACMSATKFKRCFRQLYQKTAHEYVVGVRMTEAERLLAAGGLPIAEVAYAVGYLKPGAFAAVFKRHTGMSPGAYRTSLKRASATSFFCKSVSDN